MGGRGGGRGAVSAKAKASHEYLTIRRMARDVKLASAEIRRMARDVELALADLALSLPIFFLFNPCTIAAGASFSCCDKMLCWSTNQFSSTFFLMGPALSPQAFFLFR